MKSSIFVPKIINVGYQSRNDTYTKRLAYVIYYDNRNKLRKEASWNSWRDKEIPNDEFDNVPTSGFVLNKKVGDYDSGWNHRKGYCRVYDPRNFEFEITFENLIYILENANSIKGKGLEGEFIYGWDGKDLVLIPTESPDYQEISKYNNIIHNNETIKAKDLVVGATYIDKNNCEYVYMGKFDYYSGGYDYMSVDGTRKQTDKWSQIKKDAKQIERGNGAWGYYRGCDYERIDGYNCGKRYWFATSNSYTGFIAEKSISKKFISCINGDCSEDYSELYEKMTCQREFSPIDKEADRYIKYSFENFQTCLSEKDYWHGLKNGYYFIGNEGCLEVRIKNKDSENYLVAKPFDGNAPLYRKLFGYDDKDFVPLTAEELYEKLNPHYKEIYLINGKLYKRECYYEQK